MPAGAAVEITDDGDAVGGSQIDHARLRDEYMTCCLEQSDERAPIQALPARAERSSHVGSGAR